MQDALGGTVTSEYDLNGRTLSTTDQNGHTTTWKYDVLGQVLAEVSAAGYVTAMEYDSIGNIWRKRILSYLGIIDESAIADSVKFMDKLGGYVDQLNLFYDFMNDDSYISQVTIILYRKDYLESDKNRENLIKRYSALYMLVSETIERGAVTYCKTGLISDKDILEIDPDSVKIVDEDLLNQIMDELGYMPEDILERYPREKIISRR